VRLLAAKCLVYLVGKRGRIGTAGGTRKWVRASLYTSYLARPGKQQEPQNAWKAKFLEPGHRSPKGGGCTKHRGAGKGRNFEKTKVSRSKKGNIERGDGELDILGREKFSPILGRGR